jgi:formylmethanofuran dehydrogenase subunit D
MDESAIDDTIFQGNISHKDRIEKYFNFFDYLLMNHEAFNRLSCEHIDALFDVFVENAISKCEK